MRENLLAFLSTLRGRRFLCRKRACRRFLSYGWVIQSMFIRHCPLTSFFSLILWFPVFSTTAASEQQPGAKSQDGVTRSGIDARC